MLAVWPDDLRVVNCGGCGKLLLGLSQPTWYPRGLAVQERRKLPEEAWVYMGKLNSSRAYCEACVFRIRNPSHRENQPSCIDSSEDAA